MTVNWTRNRNKVLYLNNGATNLQLNTYQASISVNATVGQPFGQIFGQTYTYYQGKTTAENRIVNAATSNTPREQLPADHHYDQCPRKLQPGLDRRYHQYFQVQEPQACPSWSMSARVVRYGRWTNTMARCQVSCPTVSGLTISATKSVCLLHKVAVSSCKGVKADGTPNTTRTAITSGNSTLLPPPDFAYDASYVKLRELSLGYHIPGARFGNAGKVIKGVDIQLLGRNLWIIHKNLPMADPEDGASAGNNQGLQFGSYPTVRSLGLNLKMQF